MRTPTGGAATLTVSCRGLRTTTGVVTEQQLSDRFGDAAAHYLLLRHRPGVLVDLRRWNRRDHDNPYFRVQHAHARLCRLLTAGAELGIESQQGGSAERRSAEKRLAAMTPAVTPAEKTLIDLLAGEESAAVVAGGDPVRLIGRLERLAGAVHAFADLPGSLPIGDQEPTATMSARLHLAGTARMALARALLALRLPILERI